MIVSSKNNPVAVLAAPTGSTALEVPQRMTEVYRGKGYYDKLRAKRYYRPKYRALHTDKWYEAQLADHANTLSCTTCGEQLHVSFFTKNRVQATGFRSSCKKCENRQKRRSSAGVNEHVRWEVWERDNFTCQQCGRRRYLVIDHIVPRVLGGSNDLSNLQTLCTRCNNVKDAAVRGAK